MSSHIKNIVIILLSLVIVGQFLWSGKKEAHVPLVQEQEEAPAVTEPLALSELSLDNSMRTTLSLEFTSAVPQELLQAESPAEISPPVPGQWVWSNPYLLKFLAQKSLPLNMHYTVTLNATVFSDEIISGDRSKSLSTGAFALQECTLDELPSATGPDMIELEGRVRFNSAVNPENFLSAISLEEANGTAIDLDLRTNWVSSSLTFRSAPIRKTNDKRSLLFKVAPTLVMTDSNLSLGQEYTQEIVVHLDPELRLVDISADASKSQTSIELRFSTSVAAASLRKHLQITPGLDFTVSSHGRTATINGNFQPGSMYSLALMQGLTAEDGATLAAPFTTSLAMPNLEPSVDFAARGMFLPKDGAGQIAVEYVNTKSLELTVCRIFPNNLAALFQDYGYSVFDDDYAGDWVPEHLGSEIFRTTYALESTPNNKEKLNLSMSQIIPDDRPGLYKINMARPSSYRGATRWVMRTDIGLVAKEDPKGYMIWASSISSLKSLAGLEIRLISSKNQILGTGYTDDSGLARISASGNDELGYPLMLLAQKGEDFSFIFLERFHIDTTGLDVSGTSISDTGLQAYIYGKRDIYRPGETLDAMILVRDIRLNTPQTMPLKVEQFDPEGRLLRTMQLELQAGMAPVTLDVPDWALTGPYSLQVSSANQVIGSYDYQVEEFIPDRIKVEIVAPSKPILPGQDLNFGVASHYLFGPPASNLAATTKVRLIAAPFAPKGFEKYVFGHSTRAFEPLQIFSTESHLDQEGQASFQTAIPDDLTPPAALEAELTSRVQEQGGRGVTARTRIPVHAYTLYPGIKEPDSIELEPRKAASFEFVTVTPDGTLVDHPALEATLFQDRWQTVMRKTSSGFVYESVRNPLEISTQHIKSGKGHGKITIVPPTYGSYRLQLTAGQGQAVTELEFYCGGWGYSPWAVKNPARLELVADKAGYRAGETASIQIRAPFSGKVLISVEGQHVEHHETIELTDNTGHVYLPVREEWQPNVYVTATLVRKGQDIAPGSTGRAFGAIPLFVDSISNKMKIHMDTPTEIRPHSDLTIGLRTAPEAKVTIAVVDEGILQLIGGKNPDPFSFFYAKRSLDVISYDNFALLFPQIGRYFPPLAGGGDAMYGVSDFIRTEGIRRVKPVTFWSGLLTADATGNIQHTISVPEFQGALRIVAVANNGKGFGISTAQTRVRTPLVVIPTLPRFLSLGDELEIPVTLRNDTTTSGSFVLNATLSGPATWGAIPESVHLETGRDTTIYLPLICGQEEGKVSVTITATGNGEVTSSTEDLDQRSPLPVIRRQETGTVKTSSASIGQDATQDLLPETITRAIRLSNSPLSQFTGHLDTLLAYPYGCAEQIVSKAFPLLYFSDLAAEVSPGRFSQAGPAGLVQTTIRRLQFMQTSSGGYAFWPGGNQPNPWVSTYVGHFLLEARQAGHHIPPRMLDGLFSYLQRQLGQNKDATPAQVEKAAYALYVLARGQQADLGSQDFMRASFEKSLTGVARTLLAGAYFATENFEVGAKLLHVAPNFDETRKESGGNLGSSLRDRALVSLILLDHFKDDPRLEGLINRISQDLSRDFWYTTQETSLAFMAMGKYLHQWHDDTQARGPFSGTLTWPEGENSFHQVETFILPHVSTAAPFTLDKTPGDQPVFYTLLTSGAPTLASHKAQAQGLEVQQVLLTEDGQPLDTQAVRQGQMIIMKTMARSTSGQVDNVIVQSLLASGLEVENPRLETTEHMEWMDTKSPFMSGHQDLRDDRILVFTSLNKNWTVRYSLLRAITPGIFTLPPVQVEAMYLPEVRASGELGTLHILKNMPTP